MRAHSHALVSANNFNVNLALAACAFENGLHGFANSRQFSRCRQLNRDFGRFLLNGLIELADFVDDDGCLSLVGIFDAARHEYHSFSPKEIAVLAKRFWPGNALYGSRMIFELK